MTDQITSSLCILRSQDMKVSGELGKRVSWFVLIVHWPLTMSWLASRHLLTKRSSIFTLPSRSFHSTPPCSDFHFDTHHFVQRLEREGLNRAQAEGIMSALAEVIDESIRNMTANMVTKADQEKVRRI
jgi:Protein of unknown function (DUF1640)